MAECFQLFDVIHNVTTTHEAITRITLEVRCIRRCLPSSTVLAALPQPDTCHLLQMCQDMSNDNVMYAEIRTTPKVSRSTSGARSPSCCCTTSWQGQRHI